MTTDILVWAICLGAIYFLKKGNASIRRPYEKEASWSLMHIVYGVGLASFFSVFDVGLTPMTGLIIGVVGYEVVEEIRLKTFTKYPIDTLVDILLGIGAGYLYLVIT